MKQLMAGGGVALIGTTLVPLLTGLFRYAAESVIRLWAVFLTNWISGSVGC